VQPEITLPHQFSSPPIPTSQSILERDIKVLGAAIQSFIAGEPGAKWKAKVAKKELVRNYRAAKEAEHGGYRGMTCSEKHAVKAQVREVKRTVKEEIRNMRRH
jgi:hypothetical protein